MSTNLGPSLPITFLKEINSIISRFYGLSFDEFSLIPLSEKVSLRMKILNIENPAHYLKLLVDGKKELTNLLESLTINVTSFFRLNRHFDFFRKTFLPQLEKHKEDKRQLRIWSAGCSNGPEPYSIAMEVANYFKGRENAWDIKILASDINFQRLLEGKKGEYKESLINDIPELYQKKYCEKLDNKIFKIHSDIQNLITWDYHNLLYENGYKGFDIIFCRNVLYYFPEILQYQVLSLFHQKLMHNGILLMGSSEHAAVNSNSLFESHRFKDFYFYQKKPQEK